MFSNVIISRRRPAPRTTTDRTDRRSGVPAGRLPAPMPRMRWFS